MVEKRQLRVGVLLGGLGAEKEISIQSGEAVARALEKLGHDVTKIYVDHDLDRVLRQTPIDVAFNALHGPFGEDGRVQGMLDMLQIPYTGSGVLPSALAMDKLKSKELFRLYNVTTPPYYAVNRDQVHQVEQIHGSFGFPVFVKPRRLGSSVGAGRASTLDELRTRCNEAVRFDSSVIIERYVRGRDVTVALLDGKAIGALEIAPCGQFYDYRSKYQSGQSEYHIPPRLPESRYKNVLTIAERANECLGAVGATRVDLLVTEGENEYVLEVNTQPGLRESSLLPMIAKHSGWEYEDLCAAILDRANVGARAESKSGDADITADVVTEPQGQLVGLVS